MSRRAVLIGNSLASQHTQVPLRQTLPRRTIKQVASTLQKLPDRYAFEPTLLIDERPGEVERCIRNVAAKMAGTRDVLLIYYFGHARREDDDLAFVCPGTGKNQLEYLRFRTLFHTVAAKRTSRVLFLLDCCYAGAAASQLTQLSGMNYCLIACTTPTARARLESGIERPIGVFTRAALTGLVTHLGTVSHADDSITIESLFRFAEKETRRLTKDLQRPYLVGSLPEPISFYNDTPRIISGINVDAPIESGYWKALSILTTMRGKDFEDLRELYDAVLRKHKSTFLTPYKDPSDGRIGKRPAKWTVLRRYVSFLRSVGAIDFESLRLTPRGLELIRDHGEKYNSRLLVLLDRYLRNNSLNRDALRSTMLNVLQRRLLPSRSNILTDLALTVGNRIQQSHLGLLLDLLGYMGVIGMPGRRERIYFPWSQRQAS